MNLELTKRNALIGVVALGLVSIVLVLSGILGARDIIKTIAFSFMVGIVVYVFVFMDDPSDSDNV